MQMVALGYEWASYLELGAGARHVVGQPGEGVHWYDLACDCWMLWLEAVAVRPLEGTDPEPLLLLVVWVEW